MACRSGSTPDKLAALAARYHDGEFSETVYRASLFATGLRGADLDHIVREQRELKHEHEGKNHVRKIQRGKFST